VEGIPLIPSISDHDEDRFENMSY
jgi:hypothetical protein